MQLRSMSNPSPVGEFVVSSQSGKTRPVPDVSTDASQAACSSQIRAPRIEKK
jgi:hypothetical protein